jgi:hypothetical protein
MLNPKETMVSNLCLLRRISMATVALLLLAMPLRAQQQPAVIIAMSSVDETMGDIQYAAKAAGVSQAAGLLQLVAAQYLQLLDTSAPAGIIVDIDGQMPTMLGFLPVKDFDGLKQTITAQLGPLEDQGNGIWMVAAGQPVFLKQSGKYVFLADNADRLGDLPADPAALLGGLDKRYNLGVRVNIQRIPLPLRQMMLDQMREGYDQALSSQITDSEAQAQLQKNLSDAGIKNMEMLVTQGDVFEMGLTIDQEKKHISLGYSLTAIQGSELAEQLAYIRDVETEFGVLIDSDAAVSFNMSTTIGQAQIDMLADMLKAFRESVQKELTEDGNFPNEQARAAAEKVVGNLLDVAEATVKSGKMDTVGVVILDGTSLQFTVASHIGEGAKLNETIREIVELGKQEANFPEVQLDAAKVGDTTIHVMRVPVPDEDARAVFGEQLEIAVGISADAVYLCVGADAMDSVKVIAAGNNSKPVKAVSMRASVGQLIKFGAQFANDSLPPEILAVVDQMGDRDHIELVVDAIPNGARYQLVLEEGILKLIGVGIQQAMGAIGDGF